MREQSTQKQGSDPVSVEVNTPTCIGPFSFIGDMESEKQHLLRELYRKSRAYCASFLEDAVVPILKMHRGQSLRKLDWFVMNYCKKHNVMILDGRGSAISVYSMYRSVLRCSRRACFDAFRRGKRVFFSCRGNQYPTTVAQLNYLMWCYESGVLKYFRQILPEIEKDMNNTIHNMKQKKRKRFRLENKKQARCELSRKPIGGFIAVLLS